MRYLFSLSWLIILLSVGAMHAQNEIFTPEMLWKIKRVSAIGITSDGKSVVYKISTPDLQQNIFSSSYAIIGIWDKFNAENWKPSLIEDYKKLVPDKNISPDGKYILSHKEVKLRKIHGKDFYPDLDKSTAQIYDALDYRHWDTWTEGVFQHVVFKAMATGTDMLTDIMESQPFHCPQKPFGGDEDYIWSPDGKRIVYVSKKLEGTAYVQSTNTDLYSYDLATGKTDNLTEENKGYDTHPLYNKQGDLAFLRMKTDGYEADKQDLMVLRSGKAINLTAQWDGTVQSFIWSASGDKIYFSAPVGGTIQLFSVSLNEKAINSPDVKQLTQGDFDVQTLVGERDGLIVMTRTSMNHAAEIFTYDTNTANWNQLTFINHDIYKSISKSKIEKRLVTTSDNQKMVTWVVYPPDFDKSKKYPVLLYCQGGPQSALSQFYSFRWNFQLMAAQGYIVVAPNRRGMPGHGVAWNEQISKDWGGQNIRDYLSAADDLAKESYVDKERMAAVGASYGGYSVFYLAGVHEGRFKSFIAHDGVFNTQSMYGTTEEMFFVNYDFGGPYWDPKFKKAYQEFNPASKVHLWDTPILIIQGEKDYRVPIGQGQEAFTAAQIRGIKSRLLYLPDEHHWVIKPQNSMVWQREFFRWLKETL